MSHPESTRARLAERIHEHGGTLAPRLALDGSLTHLACGPDDGRIRKSYTRVVEQQALARHYTTDALPAPTRAAAAIKLVHVEWIDECCDTGTMLPEDEYDARAPLAPRPPRPQPPPRIPMAERTISAPAPAPPAQKDLARLVHRIHSQTEPGLGQAPKRAGLLALTRAERFGQEAPKLFAQRTFHVAMADDARTRRVASAIRGAGGVLVAEQDAMYTVRPLVGGRGASQCVTHHWVELCLYYDRLVDPKAYVASEPTRAPMPVPGADAVRFSFTGVDREGPEYHHALAAIHAIGASVEDAMSKARTTHLVAEGDARQGVKAQKAAAWGVPVVGYEFLQRVLRTGRLRETDDVAPPPPAAAAAAPAAGGMDAVFGQINQGENITRSLRRVDASEMTHKNPTLRKDAPVVAEKPASKVLEGNKWTVVRRTTHAGKLCQGADRHRPDRAQPHDQRVQL